MAEPAADAPTPTPTPTQWIASFAERLGVEPPSDDDVEVLLALAGTAAHASARTAAPIACYLVGLAGATPADAARLAEEVAPEGG